MPRIHCSVPLREGDVLELPAGAARHVQVLRLQPGRAITLFNGEGGEHEATIETMGRSDVTVRVGSRDPVEREAPRAIHLAVCVPANDRMDWLVEKTTELGAASIQPLVAERGVLRLDGERAAKKRAHWQAIAVAACEQCGRNRVPVVLEVLDFARWQAPQDTARIVLSLAAGTRPLRDAVQPHGPLLVLSGPEGGLSPSEEARALAQGFEPVTLGTRVLRAETAPLAVLAALTLG